MSKIKAEDLLRVGVKLLAEGNPMRLQCSYCGNVFDVRLNRGRMEPGSWTCINRCNK